MADVSAGGIPYFIVLLFAPEKCASFKQSEYFVDLQMLRSTNNQNNNEDHIPQNNQQPQYQNYYQQGYPYNNQGKQQQ